MDMGHHIVDLLVVGLVELPLVNLSKLTPKVHLVIIDDLFDTVLRIAHKVEELVMENVRFALLTLLQSVKLVQV